MDDQKDIKEQALFASDNEQETKSPTAVVFTEPETQDRIRNGVTENETKPNWLRELYEWVQTVGIAVLLALLINQFVFSLVQVEGSSMLPTLQSKERLVITKLFYQPKAKDIVVVKSHALGKHIIKRIIALPGDVIDIRPETGDVIVNGEVLTEPYIADKLRSAGTAQAYPLTVPEGYVFVMGDNRNNSQDSRNLGLMPFEDIVGRAALRIAPFSRFGTLYENLEQ